MRNRYLLVSDVLAVGLAAWAAFAFRFDWNFTATRPEFLPFALTALAIKLPTFFLFGLYRRYWRYASLWDMVAVVLATFLASVLLSLVVVTGSIIGWFPGLSRSVPPLDWVFTLALTVGVRVSIRVLAETIGRRPAKAAARSRRVLIIGAGEAGTLVAREMQKNPQLGMRPIGFLDDDREKANKQIAGLAVMGALRDLSLVQKAQQVDEAVIAMPRAGGPLVRSVVDRCREINLSFRVVPGIFELLDGQASVTRLRPVDIADLLRRPQVPAQPSAAGYLTGARVIITGAGGSIGSELCRQVAHLSPQHLVLLGHGENSIFEIAGELRTRFPQVSIETVIADVRDQERIRRAFRRVQPTVVFHAAAHKHVPLMEENPPEAVTNNVAGTRNVLDAAVQVGVKRLVLVSTDKAAAPTNVMGASKRIAEALVARAAREHGVAYAVVRFGNVLGSRGSVVPIFKAQIERGGPITVTHPDVRRYFMTIPEAVHLILQAGGLAHGGELFVLDMGQPVLLREMAADMVRLSGFDQGEIPIVFTGLRPGEKIEEILWENDATIEPTARGDIRRVREPFAVDDGNLSGLVDRLLDAAARDDDDRIQRLLSEGIPSANLMVSPGTKSPGSPGAVVKFPST
ncbi:MAG: dTDP-glucose 4,6-dehydratase [Acidimicrobiia bacterium]